MSQTCYWQQIIPVEPLGSWQGLKYLLFEEGERHRGPEVIIEATSAKADYLRGYRDALPADRPGEFGGERKGELTQFLADLDEHKVLRVWIDE